MVLRDELTTWYVMVGRYNIMRLKANGYSIGEDPGGVTTLNFFLKMDNDTTRIIAEFVMQNIIGWWEEGEVHEVE